MLYNPRHAVLVSCKGTKEHLGRTEEFEDVFPLDWHSPASVEPPRYAVFVSKKMPALELIRNSQCFVVNFMPYPLVEHVVKAGMFHGEYHDKFSRAGLTRENCEKLVDSVRVKESAGWIECKVQKEVDVGDHVVFVGDILHSEEVDAFAKKTFHVDGTKYTTTRD